MEENAAAFITQRLLRQSGTEVDLLTAHDGREALDLVREVCPSAQCPELILLDIHMPVIDDFWFLEELRKGSLSAAKNLTAVTFHTRFNALEWLLEKKTSLNL